MNWFDYVIIVAIVASAIIGLLRGLLREVISLASWVLAVWLAWSMAGQIEPHLGGALADPAVRPWAARAVIFLLVVLIGAALGAIVTHFVRLSVFSGVDRLAGLVFGLLRGFVIIGLLAMLANTLRLDSETWYRQSALAGYAEKSADLLRAMVGERKIPVSLTSL